MNFYNVIEIFFFHLTPEQVLIVISPVALIILFLMGVWEFIKIIDPQLREENQIFFDPSVHGRRWHL